MAEIYGCIIIYRKSKRNVPRYNKLTDVAVK